MCRSPRRPGGFGARQATYTTTRKFTPPPDGDELAENPMAVVAGRSSGLRQGRGEMVTGLPLSAPPPPLPKKSPPRPANKRKGEETPPRPPKRKKTPPPLNMATRFRVCSSSPGRPHRSSPSRASPARGRSLDACFLDMDAPRLHQPASQVAPQLDQLSISSPRGARLRAQQRATRCRSRRAAAPLTCSGIVRLCPPNRASADRFRAIRSRNAVGIWRLVAYFDDGDAPIFPESGRDRQRSGSALVSPRLSRVPRRRMKALKDA